METNLRATECHLQYVITVLPPPDTGERALQIARSLEQLTGLVYQILLHLTGFTHCA